MCVRLGFYRFIFALVSSGRMGGKGFSIQFVNLTYLWIDSRIIFSPNKMLLAPIFVNSSCNAKLTVEYPFQNLVLVSRQKKSNVEDHCQRLCIYKCQLLKLMGNSHYNIKSMSYSDELIEQVIFFLFSFRLFCFIFVFTINFLSFRKFIYIICHKHNITMWNKVVPGWKDHHRLYLIYPGRANFSNISLQNEASRLHERQKVGLVRMVIRLALSPFSVVESLP